MDSLAALALATEMPKPELLLRPPQDRKDHIVSRKMIKHIVLMSFYMCIVLFIFIFLGEYIIPEPNQEYRFDLPEGCCVYPGRPKDWSGDDLYLALDVNGEDSRHMTWVFHFFVFMQIWNMVCARKIHDEFNIFEGMHKNFMFIAVWAFIVIGQIAISFSGRVFKLHTAGLSWEQHLTAMGYSLGVFIVNAILKCLPDGIIPFSLGPDSVYDRKYGKKQVEEQDNDENRNKEPTSINN